MKGLSDILQGVPVIRSYGDTNLRIGGIYTDSRKVTAHSVFFALTGSLTDGHHYISNAIEKGAGAVVCEKMPDTTDERITYIIVQDSHYALAVAASNFFGNPSSKMKLVGITGTNGKTTIASLSYDLFSHAGYKTGLISTVSVKISHTEYPSTHTTPDPVSLNKYLSEMAEQGVTHCFMEVSSHGIAQKRIAGLQFAGGVFTNLTHDHLDYHGNFKNYRDTKKEFFDNLSSNAFALSNLDDKNGNFMLQNTRARRLGYAMKTRSDYQIKILENTIEGLWTRINGKELHSRLIGKFNAYNLLAIYAIACELGMTEVDVLTGLSRLHSVRGRFEYFTSPAGVTVIVDYAHTPDALKNILNTLREIRSDDGKIITVTGAGGDRDKAKRPKMALTAVQLSDRVILTSDNPRTENPEHILDDMEQGISGDFAGKYIRITDRKQAIKTAAMISRAGDMVLIAGKGHETYQEINGTRYAFDDMKIAGEIFNAFQKH